MVVVFDDQLMTVTHKNGVAVEAPKAEAGIKTVHKRKRVTGVRAKPEHTLTAVEYLALRGGLKPDADLRVIFVRKIRSRQASGRCCAKRA